MKPINKTVTTTYLSPKTEFPIWREKSRVTTRIFKFDLDEQHIALRQQYGTPRLIWMHDTNDDGDPIYHGCSYMWGDYNPMPVTGWFRGVPLDKMFAWCEKNGLTNPKCVSAYVTITYEDVSDKPRYRENVF